MKQKKNGYIWYALAGIITALLVWAIFQDAPVNFERIEEPLENQFAD